MATLVFDKDFLDDLVGLESHVRQKVQELPRKFSEATHMGVHLEKLRAAKDDRVRTVRVDQFWRGVVVSLGEARYALLRVMRLAARPLERFLRIEAASGILLLVAAAVALLCARSGGRPATIVIALTIAVAAQFGRIAFDSLLQRDGPEHLRGRNFARFETRFQLVWVAGALIPVALLDVLTTREGYLALGVALAVAGATYVLSLRSLAAGSPPRAPDEDPEP